MDFNEQLADVYAAYQNGQRPPRRVDVDHWSDENRYINEMTGEKWFSSTVQCAVGPMRAVTEPGVRTISIMCSVQLMKTELILNTIGYFMDVDPCPMLVVQPTDGIARKFSDVRLKKMIKATPCLQDKIDDSGKKTSANTVNYKEYPGGYIVITGSQRPGNLAMLPIRLVFLDEIDKFEASSGKEGDPVLIAEKRMTTYTTNSLSIRTCSPTMKGNSRIESSYNSSDMRKPFVPCPHCGSYQILKKANVKWDKDDKGHHKCDTAQYVCEKCGGFWSEHDRLQALKKIQWRQTAPFVCDDCGHENDPGGWDENCLAHYKQKHYTYIAHCEECGKGRCKNRHAGFWANCLYSPFITMPEFAQSWVDAQKGTIEELKVFVNTMLAETFEEYGEYINNTEGLLARRKPYDAELPYEVGVITCGIDIQGSYDKELGASASSRIEGLVQGWGKDEECYNLRRFIIPGDLTQPRVWQELEKEIERPYLRADGKVSYIAAACVDLGGGFTQQVAQFCRDKIERRIWPIRGIARPGSAYPIWPKKPGRTDRIQIPFYNVGVDSAKNIIYTRLLNDQEGPGYYHYNMDFDADFFEQLTAERRVLKYGNNSTQRYYQWENPQRKRNEAFDMSVYSYAALNGLYAEGLLLNEICDNGFFILQSNYVKEQAGAEPNMDISSASTEPARPRVSYKRSSTRSRFMDS